MAAERCYRLAVSVVETAQLLLRSSQQPSSRWEFDRITTRAPGLIDQLRTMPLVPWDAATHARQKALFVLWLFPVAWDTIDGGSLAIYTRAMDIISKRGFHLVLMPNMPDVTKTDYIKSLYSPTQLIQRRQELQRLNASWWEMIVNFRRRYSTRELPDGPLRFATVNMWTLWDGQGTIADGFHPNRNRTSSLRCGFGTRSKTFHKLMIIQARAARPSITMDGKDYYSSLAPYLISVSYEDNSDGKKADDLEIVLADRDKRFISDWMPQKGAFLDAGIIAERWFAPFATALQLDCGRFWIDSIEFQLPSHTVSVKANSIPTNVRLKASIETRGWEEANLKDIASQLAEESKMKLEYPDDINNPRYVRTEMHDESALAYLMKRAEDAKLAIKVHRNKVIFYDEQKLEEQEPKFTLLYGNTAPSGGGACYRMAGGNFSTTVADTAKKAKVKHTSVESGDVSEGEAEEQDENGESENGGGTESEVDHNINVDTDAEEGGGDSIGDPSLRAAEPGSATQWNAADTTKAKAVLRDKNKHKFRGTIQLSVGNPLIAAGMTFTLKGVGQYDGKWFIESAHHEVGPQYDTQLNVRRCLKGY